MRGRAAPAGGVEGGRDAYAKGAWGEASRWLSDADRTTPLVPNDLELLATSAYMVGRDEEYRRNLERAHHAQLATGDAGRAVLNAIWVGITLSLRRVAGRASGWLGRAQRLLARERCHGVEEGYLLLATARHHDVSAGVIAARAAAIGERLGDPDLVALALMEEGRTLLRTGSVDDGLARLDEAMVAVDAGELSPIVVGLLYCSVIDGCREVYALRHTQEWTAALTRWCEQQPDMVAFTGWSRMYRAEIMQLRGAWSDALDEAQRAGGASGWSRPDSRLTGRERSTACGASSPRPSTRTARRAFTRGSRSPAWRCCASLPGTAPRLRPPSTAQSGRRPSRRSVSRCYRPAWRSCSRPATSRRRATPAASCPSCRRASRGAWWTRSSRTPRVR